MDVNLYTDAQITSRLTLAALDRHGIPFNRISASTQRESLRAAGIGELPALYAKGPSARVSWSGYRPDLIGLLAELIMRGPLDSADLNDPDKVARAVLTREQAVACIRAHQFNPADFFASHGNSPLYRGSVVSHWLGY
ncbi:glutaredoxin-like protein [Bordetella ansorpii]|uniref:Glutaredoxin-like protein n=1 Tax=Bordetella ansorpii TaxID=288768 RepID=A0A157SRT5_9BORD|nr:hypothetical protein [Bordetella ansorpii]SAI73129.1 glutaredoxin-like protein [Bordetella ansorpii]